MAPRGMLTPISATAALQSEFSLVNRMSLLNGFLAKSRKPNNHPANACPVPDALPNGKNTFVLLMAASKGGAGKSLICIHLATLAAQSGFRSLIIDTDVEGDQQSCVEWSKLRSGTDWAEGQAVGQGGSPASAADSRR